MKELDTLRQFVKQRISNPVFCTLSGAHLYGFPSKDSDFDIRGCHIIKTKEMFHFSKPSDTIEIKNKLDKKEIDLVSYEVEKFLGLLLAANGNALEQIFSPLVISTNSNHEKLKELAKNAICKKLYYHYRGLAHQNYTRYIQEGIVTVKKYLYVIRSLMSGIYVLQEGVVEADINKMNKKFKFSEIGELIKKKKQEKREIKRDEKLESLIRSLFEQIDYAYKISNLPDDVQNAEQFDKFLFDMRMENV
jgi:predicted nucleotidyltransferase